MFGEVKRLFSFTPMCCYKIACAHGLRICCYRTQWSHLHVYMNFGRHACCHFVFDLISPLTIRRVCAQCYKFCRHIHAKVCCGVFGGCANWRCSHQRSGCALCCVHCVVNVWVRSMQLAVWHGTIGFLRDCQHHAQFDQKQQR